MVGDFIEQTKQVLIDFSVPGAAAVTVNTDALKVGISKFPTNNPGSGFSVGKAKFKFQMSSLPGPKKVFSNSFEEAQDYMILSVSLLFLLIIMRYIIFFSLLSHHIGATSPCAQESVGHFMSPLSNRLPFSFLKTF